MSAFFVICIEKYTYSHIQRIIFLSVTRQNKNSQVLNCLKKTNKKKHNLNFTQNYGPRERNKNNMVIAFGLS